LLFACAKAGLILTPLNWRLTAPEIAAQLQTFEPALVCASPTHRLAVDHARALMASAPPALDLARLSIELGRSQRTSSYRTSTTTTDCSSSRRRERRHTKRRGADTRELLLDERRFRPRRADGRRRHRLASAAAVSRRRLERATPSRLVEGGNGRARTFVRTRTSTRPHRTPSRHDDDGRARDVLDARSAPTIRRRRSLESSAVLVGGASMPLALIESWQRATSTSCKGTDSPKHRRTFSVLRPRTPLRMSGRWASRTRS